VNPLKKDWIKDILLALPRISAGLILATHFGPKKFGVPWSPSDKELSLFEISPGFVNYLSESDLLFAFAPAFFGWLAGFSEVIAALLMAMGLGTRFFSSMVLITMLTAVGVHWDDGIKEILPALAFAWIALYALVLGSGRLGLDHWISRWRAKKSPGQ
jgi:putative oxidoreductase